MSDGKQNYERQKARREMARDRDTQAHQSETQASQAKPQRNGIMTAEDEDRAEVFDDSPWPKCPTCKGRGTVNPLTAPKEFFCVGPTDCPTCDGTGDCP